MEGPKSKALRSGMRSSGFGNETQPNKGANKVELTKHAKKPRKAATKDTTNGAKQTKPRQSLRKFRAGTNFSDDPVAMTIDFGEPVPPTLKRTRSHDDDDAAISKRPQPESEGAFPRGSSDIFVPLSKVEDTPMANQAHKKSTISHDHLTIPRIAELNTAEAAIRNAIRLQEPTRAPSSDADPSANRVEAKAKIEEPDSIMSLSTSNCPQSDEEILVMPVDTLFGATNHDVVIRNYTTDCDVTSRSSPAVLEGAEHREAALVKLSLSRQGAERAHEIMIMPPVQSSGAQTIPTPDDLFIQEMKAELMRKSQWKAKNVGKEQARRILEVLASARESKASEALFLTPDDALKHLDTGSFFPGPIFVDGAQPMPLDNIKNFLGEFYDNSATVAIQDPATPLTKDRSHVRDTTVGQLKERFEQRKPKIPWNCLELACHVEDGLRPTFLNNEDCRLLTKLKVPSIEDHTSRRGFDQGFKEVEKWALLAQAGSLTPPHQDSHGYSTYITVQEGIVGFGWLAKPTDEEYSEWLKSPRTFTNGQWRYKIMHPGMTVYFPNATVHFVFRLSTAGDTLAYGGHVLRCSRIVSWVKTLIDERGHRAITNEDISVSAPAYLERVAKFVKQARRMGQEEKWGGSSAIAEFLKLKEKFMHMQ